MEALAKKIDGGLSSALGAMREHVKSGALAPEHFKRITQEIFTDPMTGMGNRKAYADFLSRPRVGVHLRIDGNDFGSINKQHGFEVGDSAISSMGRAIREALHQSVGKKYAKSFRLGGDEFHVHVPDARSAARFARAVREKLESIAPIGGTHNLSLSVGMGQTPAHAEQALIHAKTAKKTAGQPTGQARTHVHSLVPGAEGPIPVDAVKPVVAPPTVVPAKEEAPPAAAVAKSEPTPKTKLPSGYMPDCIHCGLSYEDHGESDVCPAGKTYWEGPELWRTPHPVVKAEKVAPPPPPPPVIEEEPIIETPIPEPAPEPAEEPAPPPPPPAPPPPPPEPALKAEDIAAAVAKSIPQYKPEDLAAVVAQSVASAMGEAFRKSIEDRPAPPPAPAQPPPQVVFQTPPRPDEIEFVRDEEGRVTGARVKKPSTE
jgi:diguanylate cyclase (GGDEF)-like protein